MYDIKFFKNTKDIKQSIVNKEYTHKDVDSIYSKLERLRSKKVNIFNIETTNNCNMRCIMCPRTTAMTRDITTIDDETFERVVEQVSPHTQEDIDEFLAFIYDEYGINELSRDENAFYFYVSSKCVTLHGYGEPLIDPNILKRVQSCASKNIPTYFSCVPANIDVKKVIDLMYNGLKVIKFSIDSLDDMEAKEIRGKQNNFTTAYDKILEILAIKKEKNLQTQVVCTMLALSNDEESLKKQDEFMELWADKDVFAYVKSLDNRWYNDLDESLENKSHYESQYCEYPWSSLTVMANGDIVPCTQDYDVKMVFGNVKEKSLEEIWNSQAYNDFRMWHVSGDFPKDYKCKNSCDQKKLYEYIEEDR